MSGKMLEHHLRCFVCSAKVVLIRKKVQDQATDLIDVMIVCHVEESEDYRRRCQTNCPILCEKVILF